MRCDGMPSMTPVVSNTRRRLFSREIYQSTIFSPCRSRSVPYLARDDFVQGFSRASCLPAVSSEICKQAFSRAAGGTGGLSRLLAPLASAFAPGFEAVCERITLAREAKAASLISKRRRGWALGTMQDWRRPGQNTDDGQTGIPGETRHCTHLLTRSRRSSRLIAVVPPPLDLQHRRPTLDHHVTLGQLYTIKPRVSCLCLLFSSTAATTTT